MDLKNRLNSILQKDKEDNPKYLENVIKSDFFYLISNYFEVDFDDVAVRIDLENGKYSIEIDAVGDRMKKMRIVP